MRNRPGAVLLAGVLMALPCAAQVEYDQVFEQGRASMRAREYAAAAAAFERAVQLEPAEVDAWFRLGLARSANGEPDAAIRAYTKAVELDPEHAKANNNIANVLFRRGDYEQALQWYERALASEPNYMLARYHQGWVLRHFNRNEEAETAFRQCLQLEPKNNREYATRFDCLFFAGTLRFRAGDHEAAAQAMEQMLAANKNHVEARYYLGMSYRRLGRIDEAREQLEIHRRMTRAARRDTIIEKADP